MTDIAPVDIRPVKKTRFDDRIDTETRITNREVIGILGRSLKLLVVFPNLFISKLMLSLLAIIPGLYMQVVAKDRHRSGHTATTC